MQALQDDFNEHGKQVIETVRTERPQDYLKVLASILPKELNVNTSTLGEMDDDELTATLVALRDLAIALDGAIAGAGEGQEGGPEPARLIQAVQ